MPPDDLLEEDAPRRRLVDHPGERELCLQDGDLIAIAASRSAVVKGWAAGPAICAAGRRRVPRPSRRRWPAAARGRAGQDAVVQRLEGNALLGQLPLEVLVAIQTELGVVREIAAELQKEGTEVVVHGIDVVLVDHGGGADQPGIRCASLRVIAPLGPHHGRPFLGLADVDHSLWPLCWAR